MGWLGWSEEQTLDTRMPMIVLAYEGRVKMLKAVFGGGDEPPAEERDGLDVKSGKVVGALVKALR